MKNKAIAMGMVGGMVLAVGASSADDDILATKYRAGLRVSRMAKAPVIDGTIGQEEWQDAAAFTGVGSLGYGMGANSLVPEVQQVVWNIGYDDQYLYLAMHSPHQKGTYPKARGKTPDVPNALLFEDHVEIQISPHGRVDASRAGKGFFKIMVNAKDTLCDWHHFNGTDGSEHLWGYGGEVKSLVTDECWDLEMRIALDRLGVESLEDRQLLMQLVRTDSCTGIFFAGWTPSHWMDWKNFPAVRFDAEAPTFRFTRLGEIMAGDLDARIELAGNSDKPTQVEVELAVENAEGEVLCRQTRSATLAAGGRQALEFRETGLPVGNYKLGETERNWFSLHATYEQAGQKHTLYSIRFPFMKLDDDFRRKYLEPWLAGRPQSGDWEFKSAFFPYYNKLRVGVDTDFFGVPSEIQAAASFRAELRTKGVEKPWATGEFPLANLGGEGVLSFGELPEGLYEVTYVLLDGKGGEIARKYNEFRRKSLPWERNTLGINDEVIPPFNPLVVGDDPRRKGQSWVQTWGTSHLGHTLGHGGLFDQMVARMPTGSTGQKGTVELLAKPMELVVTQEGRASLAATATTEVVKAAGHEVRVRGTQDFGGLTATVDGRMEYDGWYQVALTLAPKQQPVRIDALDLEIVLDQADTLYVQRAGDDPYYGNRMGGIPAAPGVHFQSTDLLEYGGGWKSFVPRTFVGTGDAGLWFFAWTRRGWELRDEQPAVLVERLKNGDVRLRIRLLAGDLDVTEPRRLDFALQTTPVKPNHPRYRTAIEEGVFTHDTRGYRLWGDSVDSFAMRADEDYDKLRQWVLYGKNHGYPEPKEYGSIQYSQIRKVRDGAALTMYGSTWMTGLGAEDFRTFGGAWLRDNNWKPDPHSSYVNRASYGGIYLWNTPEEQSPTGVNWTRSFTDFFVWHHDKLISRSGFNGTWWDNSSIGTIAEYDPVSDRIEPQFNTLQRRDVTKRLCHVGWKHVKPPMWAMNMHTDFSFNQVFWMVENAWYADAEDQTAFDRWDLDLFRAMARTKSTMLIAKPWLAGFRGSTSEMKRKVERSLLAMTLAHDITLPIQYNTSDMRRAMRRELQYAVDYADVEECLFTGYWRSGVTLPDPALACSTFRNDRLGTTVLLLVNAAREQDQDARGTTLPWKGGVRRVYDVESGRDVAFSVEGGKLVLADSVVVPWHEFRLVAVAGTGSGRMVGF